MKQLEEKQGAQVKTLFSSNNQLKKRLLTPVQPNPYCRMHEAKPIHS
jgi:hypothetical protein